MNTQRRLLVSVGLMLLATSASFAQQVRTDFDRNTDFSQYKTYSWETVQTQDPLWVDRIKKAVNSTMAAKGLTEVPSGGDIAIVAIGITRRQQSLNTFYSDLGGGWRWGGGFGESTTTVDNYKVGTLVVDLFDAGTKKIIWRGTSTDAVASKSAKNIKELDNGVRKMFAHFPPEAK